MFSFQIVVNFQHYTCYVCRCFPPTRSGIVKNDVQHSAYNFSALWLVCLQVFSSYEKWEFFDALYYCFATLTTIGIYLFFPNKYNSQKIFSLQKYIFHQNIFLQNISYTNIYFSPKYISQKNPIPGFGDLVALQQDNSLQKRPE